MIRDGGRGKIYIYVYSYVVMAKTIMVSELVYKELKEIKEAENKSYSEVILESLHKPELKTGEGLKECVGILKGDKEYPKIMKDLKKRWVQWSKEYA